MVNLLAINEVEFARGLSLVRSLLILLFVILLGVIAARLFWLIVEPEGSVSRAAPTTRAYSTIAATGGQADISLLFRDNPFAELLVSASDLPDAPETTLNLKLIGMRAATVDAEGAAIIITPDNRQSLYAPGDKILDDVYLEHVLTDRVILKKNGALESLFRDNRSGRFLVLGGEEPRQVAIEPETGSSQQVIDRQSFIENVRFSPVRESDTITGYEVSSRGDPAFMEEAGLEDGDIVTVLNELRIADIDQEELFELIGTANLVEMDVARDEAIVHILIRFGAGNENE